MDEHDEQNDRDEIRNDITASNSEGMNKLSENLEVSVYYIVGLMFSVVSHILDVVFDLSMAYQYYIYCEYAYFILTLSFIIIPSLVNSAVSIRIYSLDDTSLPKKKFLRFAVLLLQLGPILVYYELFDYALKNRKAKNEGKYELQREYYDRLVKEDANIALLRIFECFLESAPQLVLQIAILLNIKHTLQLPVLKDYQKITICTSIVSLAYTTTMYNRSLRFARTEKKNVNLTAALVHFCWHFLVTSSRVLSISELASVFPKCAVAVCATHWLIMTIWLYSYDRTRFCSMEKTQNASTKILEALFCFVLGFIYIFVYLAPSDGETRKKYIFYYSIYSVQILASVVVWYYTCSSDENFVTSLWFKCLFLCPVGMFVAGMTFMFIYYSCFHPVTHKNTFTCIRRQDTTPGEIPLFITQKSVGFHIDALLRS